MFLRCKDTFNANKISSKILKNLYCQNSVQKYSREICVKYLHIFMLFHPYTLISQILKHVEIYTYIFFFSSYTKPTITSNA